ncbi:hypothetical protein [Ligilactobacillus saerimneri]|uniref:hypothetical protein n=1 Tax=Ligilactobacillus saerimneri TaxID=228229 RepID=UPI00242AE58E|nr:hypothetical protein [Ligilactobacillus saerimneri]
MNTVPDANKAFDAETKADKHIKEIIWKDADSIDTSLEATTKDPVAYKAVVTFNDGTTVEIDVPVKVVDASVSSAKVTPTAVTKKAPATAKEEAQTTPTKSLLKQVMRPQPMPV